MKWVGLTGGIASGKSTVSQILRELGQTVIDADHISHEVIEKGSPGLRAVVAAFGPEISKQDGTIDRRKLGQLVFGEPVQLQRLEGLLHPLIRTRVMEIRQLLQGQNLEMAFYDVPLLFEKKMQADFTAIVVVDCSAAVQVERLRKRNQLSAEEIQMRLASQLPLITKAAEADFVIRNAGGLVELRTEVLRMLDYVKKL